MTLKLQGLDKIFTLEQINPKLKIVEERFDEIQKEFRDNFDKIYWCNWGYETGYSGTQAIAYKGWQVAPLFMELKDPFTGKPITDAEWDLFVQLAPVMIGDNFGTDLHLSKEEKIGYHKRNVEVLPILTQTMREAGISRRFGISVVYPGKEISWHVDPDPEHGNDAIIRGLWGLDIKQEMGKECYFLFGNDKKNPEKRVFTDNEYMFFWGRTYHKVQNDLSTPRYCLCFDQEIDKDYLRSL